MKRGPFSTLKKCASLVEERAVIKSWMQLGAVTEQAEEESKEEIL